MANFQSGGPSGANYAYVLGTHRDELRDLPENLRGILETLFNEGATIQLKRMSQTQKDNYADAMSAAGDGRLLSTIRREVAKYVASPGDNTLNGQPFRDAKHFVRSVPMAVILDISAELQNTPGIEVGEGFDS